MKEANSTYCPLALENLPIGWGKHKVIFNDQEEPIDYLTLEANKAFEDYTGLDRAKVLNQPITKALPGIEHNKPNFIKVYGELSKNRGKKSFDAYSEVLDRWYSITAQSYEYGFFTVVFEDISEQKKAHQELKILNAKLQRSNEELEQFAYVASHDLQEPLRMVSSFLQLLERGIKNDLNEKNSKYLNYAVDGAKRMQIMIDDLLQFSRITNSKHEPENTNLNELLADYFQSFEGKINAVGGSFSADSLPNASVIPSLFSRVFQNLMENGLKYNSSSKPSIKIKYAEKDLFHEFRVIDNGFGIRPEDQKSIFKIFKRLPQKDEIPGNGIGLAICKNIIHKHGGEIKVSSELGKGSEFIICIPK